jgi:hypothetical protein
VCASSAWTRAHQSFYTDVEQLASFYPHHEYVVNAARALPLEPKRDDDVERVSKKREQREGEAFNALF